MLRELTEGERTFIEALHKRWCDQCEAEGYPVPADPLSSLVQAAVIGFSRLRESEDRAIEYAQREVEAMKREGYKPN